jgi:acetyltransferase-like isoleucine patch superfamily enzyme
MRGGWQRYMLLQISLIPSLHIRRWVYRCLGAHIGHDVVFHFKTELRDPKQLVVGKGTIIGDNALLDARGGLEFGENVNLSNNVSIYTLQHDYRDPDFRCTKLNTKVKVDKYVWIGSNVIVLPGVHIGEGAVCCAGCIVTKDIDPYVVVAGIPAKKVKERPRVLRYQFKSNTSCRLY